MSSRSNHATDEALALAAARDEAGAFSALLERYQVPLLGFLKRFAPRQQDAEDLLQETAIRLYAARGQYRPRWYFRTWAFTIARRAAIDWLRRRARDARALDGLEQAAMSCASADDAAARRSEGIWQTARSVLTREQAEALWLFHVEEIPPREIARVMDRSWVSVKTMLHRARKQVRQALEQQERLDAAPAGLRGGST